MGLSNYPGPTESLLAMLVMGIVFVVAILFNTATPPVPEGGRDSSPSGERSSASSAAVRVRRLEPRCSHDGGGRAAAEECCVCLSRFEDEDEVSEVARCKHVFHKGCLERWFQNDRSNTCPLCRSLC
ncbi:probable E3 ubiquitin-protein ligase XERICO [Rhodamnia argentea]|uniref:Probable E3 ubiquitin-protein ligase XERICO n=1 Tax=Rhodamnia argentea TaxID=178133 RepID=A0A8B8Q4S7_9MYRT|nr:probable E3 ubiquitin-protein ligase XERICO [Rhodamnia argentea]